MPNLGHIFAFSGFPEGLAPDSPPDKVPKKADEGLILVIRVLVRRDSDRSLMIKSALKNILQ